MKLNTRKMILLSIMFVMASFLFSINAFGVDRQSRPNCCNVVLVETVKTVKKIEIAEEVIAGGVAGFAMTIGMVFGGPAGMAVVLGLSAAGAGTAQMIIESRQRRAARIATWTGNWRQIPSLNGG